ncbi:CDP-archaeol synthase [Candidatus Woesearchaeota archaeon]|nr:CDP-archaeol synthase [Candidatus Woesearchaeota archaeon]
MLLLLLQGLYLMLPVAFANMTPPLMKNRLLFLATPVDGGRMWRGKPILGSHKTWRGLISGTTVAIVTVFLQQWLYAFASFRNISLLDYPTYNPILLGFLLGFGALTGDMVKSFFKRRVSVKPGKPFIPWDQLDFLLGSLTFLSPLYVPPWVIVLLVLAGGFVLHIAINHLGFYLGVRDVKW